MKINIFFLVVDEIFLYIKKVCIIIYFKKKICLYFILKKLINVECI